jgi:hypothetical protein
VDQSLLDLELNIEFTEQGVVRGASLLDRDGGYEIAPATLDQILKCGLSALASASPC